MHVVVNPIWSWPLIVLAVLGLLALVLLTYPSRIQHLPRGYRRLLLGLRLTAVVLLSLAMIRPALQHSETDKQSAELVILTDASRSTQTPDGPGGVSRREAMRRTLNDAASQFEQLSEDVEIRRFDFAQELEEVEEFSAEANGEQTAIGSVLESLLSETQSRRILGVILLSDGAQRAISPVDADPRRVARRMGELAIPVYTVGFGGSGLSDTVLDVALEDLLVSPVVFEKKLVPVSVKVRVSGAAGQDLRVRLLLEDRSGKRPGETGELVPATTGGNSQANPLTTIPSPSSGDVVTIDNLSFVPQTAGEFKLAVEVEPVAGELKQTNNRVQTLITVRKGGINVAYFDKPLRPEQKFIRAVNESDKIQLDFFPVQSGELSAGTVIGPQLFQPDKYDVYLIGDVAAEHFGPENLRNLAARVEDGAGLLMTGGYQAFGPGGYAGTSIDTLLPVRLDGFAAAQPGQIAEDQHIFKPLKMLPTRLGLQRFVMRLGPPDQNEQLWESLPPMEGANKLTQELGLAEVWAESEEGIPLLLAHEVGPARIAALAVDTTYQWVLGGQREAHQRFWQQMILWLAHKEMDTDQPVWVLAEPRNVAPGQRVGLRFGARTQEGEPIDDAAFDVRVTTADGQTHQPAPRRSGRDHFTEFGETKQPGDYWVRVQAEHERRSLGFDAYTRFIVDDRDLEMDNPAADLALLEEISALTGGLSMPPEQLVSHLNKLLESGLPNTEVTKVTRITLWDNWGFLLAFVTVMTAEWFLRKRRGLV